MMMLQKLDKFDAEIVCSIAEELNCFKLMLWKIFELFSYLIF